MTDQENDARYARLEQYSTSVLYDLLKGEIESADGGDDALIFRILEVMETREASPTAPQETQQAWERFQHCYCTPEGENQSLYPCLEALSPKPKTAPKHRGLRRLAFAAAVIAALMTCMITAQAAGLDVFGAIAQWTEETFQFDSTNSLPHPEQNKPPSTHTNAFYDEIQAALQEVGLPPDLCPTWLPEGYQMLELKTYQDNLGDEVFFAFIDDKEGLFSMSIAYYPSTDDINAIVFEKDETPVEEYVSNSRLFYIMSNLNTMTATWSDSHNLIAIAGNLSRSDLKAIIDSI